MRKIVILIIGLIAIGSFVTFSHAGETTQLTQEEFEAIVRRAAYTCAQLNPNEASNPEHPVIEQCMDKEVVASTHISAYMEVMSKQDMDKPQTIFVGGIIVSCHKQHHIGNVGDIKVYHLSKVTTCIDTAIEEAVKKVKELQKEDQTNI